MIKDSSRYAFVSYQSREILKFSVSVFTAFNLYIAEEVGQVFSAAKTFLLLHVLVAISSLIVIILTVVWVERAEVLTSSSYVSLIVVNLNKRCIAIKSIPP